MPAEPSARSQRDDSGLTLLRIRESVRSSVSPQVFSGSKTPIAAPRFLVERDPGFDGWWGSLKILLARVKLLPSEGSIHVFRTPAPKRVDGRSLGLSVLLHGSFILFLIYLHHALPVETPMERSAIAERIYYRVPMRDSSKVPPRIAPAGPGGRPGNASRPEEPALGSTSSLKDLTIVSKPSHPDNSRQTIWQRSSPPDVRIPTEMKLPMIVLGNPDIPKPAIKFDPNNTKPIQAKKQYAAEAAPSEANPQTPLVTAQTPTIERPQLPIPSGALAKPIRTETGHGQAQSSGAPDIPTPGDNNDLLVIGVDPSGSASNIALPPGNRWGEFSISPAGAQPGSPGGSPNGAAGGGGSGKEGTGGDGSVGVGRGNTGGGGNSTDSLPVSVAGRGGFTGGNGNLSASAHTTEEMIVPVITTQHLRKNALVVSSGPIGGGGLGEYNALNCGKIYTIFVRMPGTNWNLEYCPHGDLVKNTASSDVRATVIHLEQALLPPDATVKFDFLRLPVPIEKRRKLIVLKGVIGEDGAVSDVQVYKGLVPEMDEAARVALSRWRFMPALRGGKPVAVDILVGILPTASETP